MDSGECEIDRAKTDQPDWLRKAQAFSPVHNGKSGHFYALGDHRVEEQDGPLFVRIQTRGNHWVFWSVVTDADRRRLVEEDERDEHLRWKYADHDDDGGYDECAHDMEDMG